MKTGLAGQGAAGIVSAVIYTAVVLASLVILFKGLPAVYHAYEDPGLGDLRYIVDAGNVITDDYPPSLYERAQPSQQRGLDLSIAHGYVFPYSYPYAPTFAYLMTPLAKINHDLAARIWQVLTAVSTLILAGLLAARFRAWPWRLLVVATIVCWEPMLLNARIGQAGALVAALTAVAFVVFLRNRNLGAVLMGLLAFKPSAVIAPFFLTFPEKMPVWVRFYGTIIIIALVPFIWLGPSALYGWIDTLTNRAVVDLSGGHVYNQGLSAVINLKSVVGVFFVAIALILLALLVNKVEQRLGMALAAALTVNLSLLLNPHSLIYDWGVAFVGILLLRSSTILPDKYADALSGVLVITLFAAGQVVWHSYLTGTIPHYLTYWTICVILGLLLLALFPQLPSRLVSRAPADDAGPLEVEEPALSPTPIATD